MSNISRRRMRQLVNPTEVGTLKYRMEGVLGGTYGLSSSLALLIGFVSAVPWSIQRLAQPFERQ